MYVKMEGTTCVHTQNLSSAPIWMCRVKYHYQQPAFIPLILITAYSCWTEDCWGDSMSQRLPAMQAGVARCNFSVIGVLLVTWKVNLVVSFSWKSLRHDWFLWGCEVAEILLPKSRNNTSLLVCFMLSKDLFEGNLGELWCCPLRLYFKALRRNI